MPSRCSRIRWSSVGWLMQRFRISTPLRVGRTTSAKVMSESSLKHPPRLIAETGLTARRLLQHVSQKNRPRYGRRRVPHRADLNVRFVHAQSSFGLGELHIGAPQLFGRPIRHIAAQEAAPFTPTRHSRQLAILVQRSCVKPWASTSTCTSNSRGAAPVLRSRSRPPGRSTAPDFCRRLPQLAAIFAKPLPPWLR